MPTELPRDSRPILESPEKTVLVEVVDTQRDSSGQAPRAGVGDREGDGDSRLNEGCSLSSGVVAMIVSISCFQVIMLYVTRPIAGICSI